jgi:serine/threonine-protein kinase
VLPFTGLNYPNGVAVDTAGNLYVTDEGNDRVLKLPAG